MTMQWAEQELLFEGLDQKTDRASLKAGRLVTCENVVFEPGRLEKRRGYLAMSMVSDVEGVAIDPSNLFLGAATVADELVVFGLDELYAVVSRADAVDDRGIVRRGPLCRGTLTVDHVSTGR